MSLADSFDPPKRKRRRKNAAGDDTTPADSLEVALPQIAIPTDDAGGSITIDPATGGVHIENDDGSITVDPTGESLTGDDADLGPTEFDDNLADRVEAMERGRIADDLLTAIQAHKQDRSQWESMRAKCLELMGMKLDEPKSDVSTSALGMSTSVVRDPVLMQAVERFRANAYAELCPAGGPVKVMVIGDITPDNTQLAQQLEDDLNYYLTQVATEYYPDTRYMLWWTGLASGTFKKTYFHPVKKRPISEYVDGTKLIVPVNATDLKNAGLVAHESMMRPAVMKRMQYLGVYRDCALQDPMQPQISPVAQKQATIEGKTPTPQRIEDQEYTVFECYCELDLKGFEHTDEDGTPTKLPMPYKVTIEEGSKEILEIRRNWDEDDEDQLAKIPFVLFPYSTGLSRIYGSGLGQMLGNIAMALTAMLRISIDSGMAANYPGLLKAKGTGRQLSNEIRVPPGGCAEIDTGGLPIQQAVMGMPYKDISAAMMQLMGALREVAQQAGSSAELPVGEGKADIPVGTMLAQIEQATKVEGAVHKALHDAQKEEFKLFIDLFRQDPEALWRGNRRPALGPDKETRIAQFQKALENCDIAPVSDPNVPSETHRMLRAFALLQLFAGDPQFNSIEVKRRIAHEVFKMTDDDFNSLIAQAPAGAPPLDPLAVAALQINKQNADTKALQVQLQAKNAQDAIASKESIAATQLAHKHVNDSSPAQPPSPLDVADLALKQNKQHLDAAKVMSDAQQAEANRRSQETSKALDIASRIATHPESQPYVNNELMGLAPFMTPASTTPKANGGKVAKEQSTEASLSDIFDELDRAVRAGTASLQ